MKNKKQELTTGNYSTNNQAGGDLTVTNNYEGKSYDEIKAISLDVFKENFYKLSEQAQGKVNERAEILIDRILDKLKILELTEEKLSQKISNPDVQYALINAQKQYARSGEDSSLEMLTELLVQRFSANEDSLKKIVINEAIEVMTKITPDQINNLTLLFLVKSCKLANVNILFDLIYELYEKFGNYTEKSIDFYEHLQYTGLLTNDIFTTNHQPLGYLMSKDYPEDLDKHVANVVYKDLDMKVREVFDDRSYYVFKSWNESKIQDYSLTSVGKVIAISNFNNLFNAKLNLSIWIKN